MILHNQLLLNGYSATPMTDTEELNWWLTTLVSKIGMKITMPARSFYVDKDGNRGLTGIVGLQTSHAAIHVWDEKDPAGIQFDLYTCSELRVPKVLKLLIKDWYLLSYDYMVIERTAGFTIVDKGCSK